MRLDQDINFEVGGVPCVMKLDTTAMGAIDGDLWIIKPRESIYIEGHPEKFEAHFASRISDALEKLGGLDEDGCPEREPRQKYEWRTYDDHAILQVMEDGSGLTVASGIMATLPDWNGNDCDFYGSQRLVQLLTDWEDGVLDIRFTRSDGTIIKFKKFIDFNFARTVSLSWDALDDLPVS